MKVTSFGPATNLPKEAFRVVRFSQGEFAPRWGVLSEEGNVIKPLEIASSDNNPLLSSDVFHRLKNAQHGVHIMLSAVDILKPVEEGAEVWAAGVTYKRSQQARMEESVTSATNYDKVYTAPRPEIFFKANARRVSHPGDPVRVRADSEWTVPEPELTLVITNTGKVVGFTVGNDMSSRDIEGENPLYLPQAKVTEGCTSLGPVLICMDGGADVIERCARQLAIEMVIKRQGNNVFSGKTSVNEIVRTFSGLQFSLFNENSFPDGAFLLTGTGIVPPDEFTLQHEDIVDMRILGLVELSNPVVKGSPSRFDGGAFAYEIPVQNPYPHVIPNYFKQYPIGHPNAGENIPGRSEPILLT